jgi:RNA polymerase sigma-70 factor, ECF subfamily
MDIPERKIVEKIQEGNEKAFEYLYEKYYVLLCIVAREYLKDRFLAEEIVGDLFFKLWKNHARINISTTIKGYLLKSIQNSCLNYIAHVKSEQKLKDDLLVSSAYNGQYISWSEDYPFGSILVKELEGKIDIALEELPGQCREIFCLSRYNELKYEEIAERMNLSINTVKTQMKIALIKLRESLKDYLPVYFLLFISFC